MSVRAVIGKNFGDEGKGLATDYFARLARESGKSCLVIRHNGGGQAGHTVDLPEKRFVFHQFSSGSLRGADTLWASTFLPDLYKLSEEAEALFALEGKLPRLYGDGACRCVLVDDVLVNMALEESRGENRHGSCGMGINEAVERSRTREGYLSLEEVRTLSADSLAQRLLCLRREYLPLRLEALGLDLSRMGEIGELLQDENVLRNASEGMKRSAELVRLWDEDSLEEYGDVIFEGAQGLLLDEDYLAFAPHLTSSKTGAHNPANFLRTHLPKERMELVYVTRSYVTRHGAGPLPHEDKALAEKLCGADRTNLENPWQGSLRFALHGTKEEFYAPILQDLPEDGDYALSFMVTHLNESEGAICSVDGQIPAEEWFSASPCAVERLYRSATPFSRDITAL